MARWYIGGLLHHAPSLLAFTNPTVNSYRRLVPGYEAPVNLVYSQRNRSACTRIPVTGSNPKAKRVEFRVPDPSANPYLSFSAQMMAGLDGIKNKIEPPAPIDKDLYDLPPEEWGSVKQVPGSLDAVLNSLEADNEFLTAGGVFTPDLIETWNRLQAHERDRPGAVAPDPARVRDVLQRLTCSADGGHDGYGRRGRRFACRRTHRIELRKARRRGLRYQSRFPARHSSNTCATNRVPRRVAVRKPPLC